ncbi:hypothetical protein HDU67_007606 [Dinochytrium kinnereticum]|nr:hypothetical protein HDU67_007606 [Dinochytrium kinnereticum]
MATLSAEEAALYDRQIRLWGLESQTRMRNAEILVIGITGLTNEVCKNLVLAGVGSIKLCDSRVATPEDLGAQFLLPENLVGTNRAEAVLAGLLELNPRVKISVVQDDDVFGKDVSFFQPFHLVFVADFYTLHQLNLLNNSCRSANTQLMVGFTMGLNGFLFSDLGHYEYIEERKEAKEGGAVVARSKKTEKFKSLTDCLAWTPTDVKPRALKKWPPLFFGVQVLWEFEASQKRMPKDNPEDVKILSEVRDKITTKYDSHSALIKSLLPDTYLSALASQACAEITPVCAILGGIAGQEILNAIAGKEVEVNNVFCFSALDNSGMVLSC